MGINNPNIEEDEILTIPPATSSGTYYILFVADSENLIDEGTLENNNVECIQITVNGTSTPSLTEFMNTGGTSSNTIFTEAYGVGFLVQVIPHITDEIKHRVQPLRLA